MPEYLSPGVFVEEILNGTRPFQPIGTTAYGVVGEAERGPVNVATLVTSFGDFQEQFGDYIAASYMPLDVFNYFRNGGTRVYVSRAFKHDTSYVNPADIARNGSSGGGDNEETHKAQVNINNSAGSPSIEYYLTAESEGTWGNRLSAVISKQQKLRTNVNGAPTAGTTFIDLDSVASMYVGTILRVGRVAKVQTITCVADVAGSLNNTYFLINSAFDEKRYYVWFNVNSAGTDPAVSGRTGVEVALATGAADTAVATALATALDALDEFSASPSTADVVVTNAIKGGSEDAADGTAATGFSFAVSTPENDFVTKVTNIVGRTVETEDAMPSSPAIVDNDPARTVEFGIVVSYRGVRQETFNGLSTESDNTVDYAGQVLTSKSRFIRWNVEGSTSNLLDKQPAEGTYYFAGGSDGLTVGTTERIGTEAAGTGLYAFDTVMGELLSIGVPDDASQTMTDAGLTYCENKRTAFFISTTAAGLTAVQARDFVESDAAYNSSYGAVYWPWIRVNDPRSRTIISMPPQGAVAGVYARTDLSRGIAKTPAGMIDGRVRGGLDVEVEAGKGKRDILYQARVNPIIKEPGQGVIVYGGRTLSADTSLRYIANRRYLLQLAMVMERGLQWSVFENNEWDTWLKIRMDIGAFLLNEWRAGNLRGRSPSEAFYVVCDETTNPPSQVEQGILRARIGVALQKPAEFVVIEIEQDTRALQAELAAAGIQV